MPGLHRAKIIAVNFVLNAVIFYIIGRWLRGHRTGVRAAVIGGVLSAMMVVLMEERFEEEFESVEEEI